MADISDKIFDQRYIDMFESLRVDSLMLATRMDTLAAKLNADAGVTDANYVTTQVASIVTTA
jgi:hypothetical protein